MNIQENVAVGKCTSFGSGGNSQYFLNANSSDELIEAVKTQPKPFWLLGKGANSLISDKGLPGTTIHIQMENISFEDDLLIAESGAEWDDVVVAATDQKLWGLELTSGIPGTVGAAVVGNIAAYGQAISDTLEWIEVINHDDDEPIVSRLTRDELGLGYRTSFFAQGKLPNLIILRAAFRLSTNRIMKLKYESALKIARELELDPSSLENCREIIMTTRGRAGSLLNKDHTQKTAGSFFKNPMVSPEKAEQIMNFEERDVSKDQIKKQNTIHGGDETRVSAAHVILAAGFNRGQTWGNVRIHPDHALKIENTGGASSQDIYNVAMEIVDTVKTKLDITLSPEVKFLGDFDLKS